MEHFLQTAMEQIGVVLGETLSIKVSNSNPDTPISSVMEEVDISLSLNLNDSV